MWKPHTSAASQRDREKSWKRLHEIAFFLFSVKSVPSRGHPACVVAGDPGDPVPCSPRSREQGGPAAFRLHRCAIDNDCASGSNTVGTYYSFDIGVARRTLVMPTASPEGVHSWRIRNHVNYLASLAGAEPLLAEATTFRFTRQISAPALPPAEPQATLLRTVDLRSLDAGLLLQELGCSTPAVLNFANEFNCGGTWIDCAGSQEEDFFRRSTLPLSLWPRRRLDDTRLAECDTELPRSTQPIYPLSECNVVYSPCVRVTKANGKLLTSPSSSFAVISSAAQDLRVRKYAGRYDEKLSREKARSILWAAVAHGHTSLVLGEMHARAMCVSRVLSPYSDSPLSACPFLVWPQVPTAAACFATTRPSSPPSSTACSARNSRGASAWCSSRLSRAVRASPPSKRASR